MFPNRSGGLAIDLLLLERFALVVQFFAATDAELDLDPTFLEVDFGRHQRQAAFIDLFGQFVDLFAMQQQFALADGIVVVLPRVAIR